MPGTIGNTVDCKDVTQNSYNGNTYNLVSNLRREPRNVEVKAIRDYTLLYFLISFMVGMLIFIAGTYVMFRLDNEFIEKHSLILEIFLGVSGTMGAFVSVVFLEYLMQKFAWGHIIYKDKSITYKEEVEKFYHDIWDMELKETRFGYGRLRYFGINKNSNKPFTRSITISKYAEAKYIYDSFWSTTR